MMRVRGHSRVSEVERFLAISISLERGFERFGLNFIWEERREEEGGCK